MTAKFCYWVLDYSILIIIPAAIADAILGIGAALDDRPRVIETVTVEPALTYSRRDDREQTPPGEIARLLSAARCISGGDVSQAALQLVDKLAVSSAAEEARAAREAMPNISTLCRPRRESHARWRTADESWPASGEGSSGLRGALMSAGCW